MNKKRVTLILGVLLAVVFFVSSPSIAGLEEPWASMPEQINVYSNAYIPLWYADESGYTRIPCRVTNPIKYGMPFQIAVTNTVSIDASGIAYIHTDYPGLTNHYFNTNLQHPNTPPALKGRYSGLVTANPYTVIRVVSCRRS